MREFVTDFVVTAHVIFVIVILACLPIAFIYPRSHKIILIFIAIVLLQQIPHRRCILTHFENRLRREDPYHGNFLVFYAKKFFDVKISDHAVNVYSAVYFIIVILVAVFFKLHQAHLLSPTIW